VKELLAEFKAFAFSGSLLDVAIGIAIGVAFLTDLLAFLLLAVVVLFPVKAVKRLTGKEAAGAQGNRECDYCKSFIPVDASVCMFCTRDVEPLVA
jgi:large conductance mechanosensitive channel